MLPLKKINLREFYVNKNMYVMEEHRDSETQPYKKTKQSAGGLIQPTDCLKGVLLFFLKVLISPGMEFKVLIF